MRTAPATQRPGPSSEPPVPALHAQSIYRFFRAGEEETLALQGVTLTVHPGEMVAVVGPSGSGKSTLLACLAGLDEPAGGTVTVAGSRISHRPETERTRLRARHIGILLQSRNLLAHLSVRDNIRLAQYAAHDADRPDPADLLDGVGLGDRRHALPRQLSGGELARAGLAVAMANLPDVILADEPTGELDGATEQRVLDLLHRAAADGVGLLVVTHSRDVTATADRVLTLTDGRITS